MAEEDPFNLASLDQDQDQDEEEVRSEAADEPEPAPAAAPPETENPPPAPQMTDYDLITFDRLVQRYGKRNLARWVKEYKADDITRLTHGAIRFRQAVQRVLHGPHVPG